MSASRNDGVYCVGVPRSLRSPIRNQTQMVSWRLLAYAGHEQEVVEGVRRLLVRSPRRVQ